MGCPTKLYYSGNPDYINTKTTDSFLEALADGGYQVGELARCYFPGGHDITTLDYEEAERQTLELMKKEDVILFEPAVRFKDFFIRIDILVKSGHTLKLIEVKAKSFDCNEESPFLNKRNGKIKSDWQDKLLDIAFQTHVLCSAYPGYQVIPYLMCADKHAICKTEGLNQKFRVTKSSNRKGVEVAKSLTKEDLDDRILCQINVEEPISLILSGEGYGDDNFDFADTAQALAEAYKLDKKIPTTIGSKCQSCEFRCSAEEKTTGKKSGFEECWSKALGWAEEDFKEPTILNLWNFRRKDEFFEAGKIKLSDIEKTDIPIKTDGKPGLSTSERQWLQIEKIRNKDNTAYVDMDGLKNEMSRWTFPLHFIDFETIMVALPFNKGMKPYEGILFQFSHHVVYEDGRIEHFGEFIDTEPGRFPSYYAVRELMNQLGNDHGTIFKYSNHENTYLLIVYDQLKASLYPPEDREQLMEFIRSITHRKLNPKTYEWIGNRDMVDMLELEKRFYYDPSTNGSNSIKYVLPAVLNSSGFLKEKYSKPIYGSPGGIKSHNYKNWTWVRMKGNRVEDPYKLLPRMFQDVSDREMELLSSDDELKEGGAAMTAYARMQFSEMSDYERNELRKALLMYCELDTLAMVMISEAWRDWVT